MLSDYISIFSYYLYLYSYLILCVPSLYNNYYNQSISRITLMRALILPSPTVMRNIWQRK